MFVDDYIINIIPYHSAPSLVLIKDIDLSFLLFIAANKYLKKLFALSDCIFVNSKMHSLICGDIYILTIFSLLLLLLL